MAKKTQMIVTYTCDVCEREVGEEGTTLRFGVNNDEYEIDLCREDHGVLMSVLERHMQRGRKVESRGRRRSSGGASGGGRGSGPDAKAVRAWAVANGREVPTRGRIPREIVEAYEAATG